MHYCAYHKAEHDESEFRTTKYGKLDSWCIEGRREYNRAKSRENYAARKAEVAREKLERAQRPSQTCTSCGEEKPIEEFPLRTDRPDKRQAKCEPCLMAWKRETNRAFYARSDGALYASQKRAIVAEATIGDSKMNKEYAEILRGDPCCYCGSREKIEIDHIVPIQPGSETHGDHDWTNFTAACRSCNGSKNDADLLNFLLRRN